jgi:hypothetical protein
MVNSLAARQDTEQQGPNNPWGGAVLVGTGLTSATGTFNVPTPQMPAGGSASTSYCASTWVGIDGYYSCQSGLLQAGVDVCIKNNQRTYTGWFEWWPRDTIPASGLTFSPGDSVTVTVTATNLTSGVATITNNTKNKSVKHTFPTGQPPLCLTSAEWIVEDFEINNKVVPFANFGSVTFTGASATSNNVQKSPAGATILNLQENDKTLTSSSVSGNSVTVNYQSQ